MTQRATIDLRLDEPSTARSAELYRQQQLSNCEQTDRVFALLMALQWLAGIAAALWISPLTWAGRYSETHIHVWVALLLGGAITSFPVYMAVMYPGKVFTRHAVAIGQMLTSGLLVHLTGGRIETHFHYFGSLAFLAFYRDWRVLLSATIVAAADHGLRGLFWPESIFGVMTVSPWRWLEHTAWVLFEDTFLLLAIRQNQREMLGVAERQAKLEHLHATMERKVEERTSELQFEIAEHIRTSHALQESRQEMANIVNTVEGIVWECDADTFQFSFVSEKAEQILGYPVQAWLDDHRFWHKHVHPDDLEAAANYCLQATRERVSHQLEYRMIAADGRVVWLRDFVTVICEEGKAVKLRGIFVDITNIKQTEDELRWKTAFLEAQVDCSIDGILVVNIHGHRILQNEQTATLLEIPPEIVDDPDDRKQVEWVANMTTDPDTFRARVQDLFSQPDGIGRDEIELKNGTVLDRYTAPVMGKDGTHFGRIWTFRDITDRKRAEAALRSSEERFADAFDHASIGMALVSPEGRWLRVNQSLCAMVGYAEDEMLDLTFQEMTHPEDLEQDLAQVRQMLSGELRTYEMEKRYFHKKGHILKVLLSVSLVRDAHGQPLHFISQIQDITERRRLEAQLFQSQKMETVGKLAGGVAHEFNSIMTAIIGQSELLLSELAPRHPHASHVTEIRKAADRAAILTRQLLAYSRKQILRPETLDLNKVLAGMDGMLRHLMGAEIDLRIVPFVSLQPVRADAGQVEQVVLNMAINAREAMPNGGKLTLETCNISFDEKSVGRHPDLKPGEYVMLAITDTGAGMSPEVKARAFEPFFSTKSVGQGTGLGLATCYGIVKQSGGHISVYSEPQRGTTFKVYLPQIKIGTTTTRVPVRRPSDLPGGKETILLVEDDPSLREMAADLLRRLGYTVLTASNGLMALSLVEQRGTEPVDLLFSDMVMPHLSGKELADRLLELHPHTKVLFTSAYTEHAIVHQGVLNPGVALLQKPFTPAALARKMREVLDAV